MKDIQIADKEWSEIRHALRTGQLPTDVFVVQGPAEEIAVQVQSVLEDIASIQATWSYFLDSGSKEFGVPFYAPTDEKACTPESIEAYHVFTKKAPQNLIAQERVVKELERDILQDPYRPHFLIIEFMTPPRHNDIAFTLLLLKSSPLRRIPTMIFIHKSQIPHHTPLRLTAETTNNDQMQRQYALAFPTGREQHGGDVANHLSRTYDISTASLISQSHLSLPGIAAEELLCLLYLCGGRMRETEWQSVVGQSSGEGLDSRWIATRHLGAEKWFCYAHGGVAQMADHLYHSMSQERKYQLAQRILQHLPNHTGYPLLAIASETGDLDLMLSRHSWEILEVALLEPESVVRYFEQLQQVAEKQENALLVKAAYTNYLGALILVDQDHVVQVYQKQRGISARPLDTTVEAFFWHMLGDELAVMNQPEIWHYAEDCLHRSRKCIQNRYSAGEIKHVEFRLMLANVANVEALIAYKRRQGEEARILEEQAITEAKQVVIGKYFQIHLRVNLGDVLLHLLGDTEAAIAQYTEALAIVLHLPEKLKRWAAPRKGERNELRAAQRLGDALLQVNRNEEAIKAFDALLFRLAEAIHLSEGRHTALVLRARLSLAQAYLKVGRQRSAAVCYWRILRQPAWLDLEVLKDAAEKLRALRPGLHERLQQRIDGILALRENRMADIAYVQNMLSRC